MLIQKLTILLLSLFSTFVYAADVPVESMPQSYWQSLNERVDHKFDDNQIKSFIYYWYGLHDKHVDINKSLELLSKNKLLMVYPEITVKNTADFIKWYTGVGKNIKSNVHIIKELNVTPLPEHKYKVNIIVNWQAIDKNNKFTNIDATQEWILVDGSSNKHPYIEQYKVLKFIPVESK